MSARPSLDAIARAVAAHFHVGYDGLMSMNRAGQLARARQAAYYFANIQFGYELKQIAEYFSRDPTSVSHGVTQAIQAINKRADRDEFIALVCDPLRRGEAPKARAYVFDHAQVEVPAWVPKELRGEYRQNTRLYGECEAASIARKQKRAMAGIHEGRGAA